MRTNLARLHHRWRQPVRPPVVHGVTQLPSSLLRRVAQHSVWERTSVAAALLGAALAAGSAWAWWSHRRQAPLAHARLLHTLFALACGVATLLGAAVAVNSYAGYAPSWSALVGDAPATALTPARLHALSDAGSIVTRLQIAAPSLHVGSRAAYVYLPPGYFDPRNHAVRYSVIYLLHGVPGHPSDWLMGGSLRTTMDALIADGSISPAIVVMPQTNASFFDDSECLDLPGSEQDETYITRIVVRTVDSTFRTIANRSGRAIGGMSAGGFCALNLGLRHLGEYSVVLASEPYADPGRGLVSRLHGWATWRANAPRDYLPRMRFRDPVAVFLDAGSRDRHTLPVARWLAAELARRGQYVALRVAPHQAHTWTAARVELPYSLVFADAHMTHETQHPRRDVGRA